MKIKTYLKPTTIEEAYKALTKNDNAQIIGGGMFVRLSTKESDIGIDLCDLGLNTIEEKGNNVEIGAMTTFGDMQRSAILGKMELRILIDSLKDIVGTQFRNMATIGGTVFGRYGFSEPLTALLALNAKVVLYKEGEISLEDYLAKKGRQKDIVTKIIIPKNQTGVYKAFKNSYGDFPLLTVAVAREGDEVKIAVGAKPTVASVAYKAMASLKGVKIDEKNAQKAAELAFEELNFGTDRRASKEYRQELCKVLVKRAILEVAK